VFIIIVNINYTTSVRLSATFKDSSTNAALKYLHLAHSFQATGFFSNILMITDLGKKRTLVKLIKWYTSCFSLQYPSSTSTSFISRACPFWDLVHTEYFVIRFREENPNPCLKMSMPLPKSGWDEKCSPTANSSVLHCKAISA